MISVLLDSVSNEVEVLHFFLHNVYCCIGVMHVGGGGGLKCR